VCAESRVGTPSVARTRGGGSVRHPGFRRSCPESDVEAADGRATRQSRHSGTFCGLRSACAGWKFARESRLSQRQSGRNSAAEANGHSCAVNVGSELHGSSSKVYRLVLVLVIGKKVGYLVSATIGRVIGASGVLRSADGVPTNCAARDRVARGAAHKLIAHSLHVHASGR
jgi:hypothetical protein